MNSNTPGTSSNIQPIQMLIKDIRSRFNIVLNECDVKNDVVMCERLLVITDFTIPRDFVIGSVSEAMSRNVFAQMLMLKDDIKLNLFTRGHYINHY